MNQFFWNAYKRLEKEVLALSEYIQFSDDQLMIYSPRISDLLVRTAIEFESLAKELYYANGGVKPVDRDLYFDTDCMGLLESKWLLSKKTIYINTPYFYFSDPANTTLTPLHNTFKRRKSASKWQRAYHAVKHDRIHNLKKGNVFNLINALGALYILNIYYKDAKFDNVSDNSASNVDWGLGSEVFSVKISCESSGASNDQIYVKKADYDECIYLVKHTDKTAQAFIDVMAGINKQISEQTVNDVTQSLNAKIKAGKIGTDEETLKEQTQALFQEKNPAAMRRVIEKEKFSIHNAIQGLRYEAVLNKQQY
ncbi:MAG: hypothetical protein E7106_00705 [Prevotella sp.]|nr:hypothetical protein [Prevotella sp.]